MGAAQVGDILEISVQSPNPLIRVEPLRHTVTSTDVKNSRIELTELIAYEMPTDDSIVDELPEPVQPGNMDTLSVSTRDNCHVGNL